MPGKMLETSEKTVPVVPIGVQFFAGWAAREHIQNTQAQTPPLTDGLNQQANTTLVKTEPLHPLPKVHTKLKGTRPTHYQDARLFRTDEYSGPIRTNDNYGREASSRTRRRAQVRELQTVYQNMGMPRSLAKTQARQDAGLQAPLEDRLKSVRRNIRLEKDRVSKLKDTFNIESLQKQSPKFDKQPSPKKNVDNLELTLSFEEMLTNEILSEFNKYLESQKTPQEKAMAAALMAQIFAIGAARLTPEAQVKLIENYFKQQTLLAKKNGRHGIHLTPSKVAGPLLVLGLLGGMLAACGPEKNTSGEDQQSTQQTQSPTEAPSTPAPDAATPVSTVPEPSSPEPEPTTDIKWNINSIGSSHVTEIKHSGPVIPPAVYDTLETYRVSQPELASAVTIGTLAENGGNQRVGYFYEDENERDLYIPIATDGRFYAGAEGQTIDPLKSERVPKEFNGAKAYFLADIIVAPDKLEVRNDGTGTDRIGYVNEDGDIVAILDSTSNGFTDGIAQLRIINPDTVLTSEKDAILHKNYAANANRNLIFHYLPDGRWVAGWYQSIENGTEVDLPATDGSLDNFGLFVRQTDGTWIWEAGKDWKSFIPREGDTRLSADGSTYEQFNGKQWEKINTDPAFTINSEDTLVFTTFNSETNSISEDAMEQGEGLKPFAEKFMVKGVKVDPELQQGWATLYWQAVAQNPANKEWLAAIGIGAGENAGQQIINLDEVPLTEAGPKLIMTDKLPGLLREFDSPTKFLYGQEPPDRVKTAPRIVTFSVEDYKNNVNGMEDFIDTVKATSWGSFFEIGFDTEAGCLKIGNFILPDGTPLIIVGSTNYGRYYENITLTDSHSPEQNALTINAALAALLKANVNYTQENGNSDFPYYVNILDEGIPYGIKGPDLQYAEYDTARIFDEDIPGYNENKFIVKPTN